VFGNGLSLQASSAKQIFIRLASIYGLFVVNALSHDKKFLDYCTEGG
jgi:hypothetical protein